MPSTIITKNSSTPGAVPTAGQLSKGELALNVSDRRLYTKDNTGAVVEVGAGTAIIYRDNFTGNGATTAFTLPRTPLNEELVDVYIDGIYQNKDTWSLAGAVITFTEAPTAPVSGTGNIEVLTWQSAAIGETASNFVSYTPAGTGAVATNVQSKLREFVSVKDFGAVGDGVTDDTAAIIAADIAAAAVRTKLVFPTGIFKVTNSITFTSTVEMFDGAVLTCSDSTKFFKFSRGFIAGLNPCIDTDAPTQFVGIEAIYPQWFGNCGLTSQDSTIALRRAFRATRAGMNGISATTDASFGCVRVHLIRGEYRCNDVDVYCQTIVTGEVTGALNGSYITQIDRTKPALRVHAKNYSLTNTVLNDSNGINTFHRVTFRGSQVFDTAENEFIVRFYSPAESTALFAVAGDGIGGDVGHIDTMFERCWFQFTPGFSVGARDGKLIFWMKQCTFDVVRGGVHYAGTSYGRVHLQNVQAYLLVRGLARVDTSSANATSVYIEGAEILGAGNCQNADASYRRLLHYIPTGSTAGEVIIYDTKTERRDVSGSRYGGPILVRNAARFVADNVVVLDADSADNFKHVSIGATEVYISNLRLKSDLLASYVNSRLLTFATAPSVLRVNDTVIYNTNASAVADAVQADAALTNAQFDVQFSGNFTASYNTNILAQNLRNSIRRLTVEKPGTAAPVSGTWVVGDRVINSAPTVGQPRAWVCTVAGTPGTWVSEGNL